MLGFCHRRVFDQRAIVDGKDDDGHVSQPKVRKKNAHFCLRRRAEKKLWVFLRHSGNFSAGAHAYE